jgi:hypothetical protein
MADNCLKSPPIVQGLPRIFGCVGRGSVDLGPEPTPGEEVQQFQADFKNAHKELTAQQQNELEKISTTKARREDEIVLIQGYLDAYEWYTSPSPKPEINKINDFYMLQQLHDRLAGREKATRDHMDILGEVQGVSSTSVLNQKVYQALDNDLKTLTFMEELDMRNPTSYTLLRQLGQGLSEGKSYEEIYRTLKPTP